MTECPHCGSRPVDRLDLGGELAIEEVLWRAALQGMRDYRECGEIDYLNQARRAIGTWLHFTKLCVSDLNQTP